LPGSIVWHYVATQLAQASAEVARVKPVGHSVRCLVATVIADARVKNQIVRPPFVAFPWNRVLGLHLIGTESVDDWLPACHDHGFTAPHKPNAIFPAVPESHEVACPLLLD